MTGAVVIAAGLSSRMGRFKPLLPLGGETVVGRLLSTLRAGGVSVIVVVTGFHADELEAHIRADDVIFVRNERYAETQMFDSVRLGFAAIESRCRRFFFTPVDIPLFTVETLRALLKVDAPVVYPSWNGLKGHPVLIDADAIPSILDYRGEGGLRGALAAFGPQAAVVEVPDAGTAHDADTPEEFAALVELLEKRGGK
ncbi:MAG: nucleotidyltransferase family protein [Oscillospiraceae bacterium]|nr:nucleotidyltransferase family protein [Oscillospiraceae bacterium]